MPAALRWFLVAALTGAVAGLGAIGFYELSQFLFETLSGDFAGWRPGPDATVDPVRLLLLLAVGGLLVGIIVERFAPEAKGHGTDAVIKAFHFQGGYIRPVVIWVKLVASAITLGVAGSGGREGPIAQVGAGFGSWFATMVGLSKRERRILLATGMGAGIGAIFQAPLAGALFAAEVMYNDPEFEADVIMPTVLACIVSYSVYVTVIPRHPIFPIAGLEHAHLLRFGGPMELVPYGILAVVLAGLVHFYVKCFYGTEGFFDRLRIRPWLKPAIGMTLTGVVALGLYYGTGENGRVLDVLGFGYSSIRDALAIAPLEVGADVPAPPWGLIIALGLVSLGKVFTTSLTIGSGGSAGVFGPSIVIGGTAGAAIGLFFMHVWPDVAPHPGAFTIVGMAGFFAAAGKVPISTLIMVSEITGNYKLLIPSMWVGAITFGLTRRISIFSSQVRSMRESPAHRGDLILDVLVDIPVSALMDKLRKPAIVRVSTPLRNVMDYVHESDSHYFPVLDTEDRLVGIFSMNDIRRYLHDETMWDLLIAADIMTRKVLSVTPENSLHTVMRRVTSKNIDELPVVDVEDSQKLLGMLRRREVIDRYNASLEELGHVDDDAKLGHVRPR